MQNEQEILSKLENIFREVFVDSKLQITNATNADDIESWDSLTHMQLINEVEEHFKIAFTLDEVMQLNDVGNLVQLIHSKGV